MGPTGSLIDRSGKSAPRCSAAAARTRPGCYWGATGFSPALRKRPYSLAGGIVATRLCFDEIGEDEGIDFLRHQLAARQVEDERAGIRPVVLRGVAVVIAF